MGLLTKGHIITCSDRNRRGGIKTIYLGEVANVTGTTPATPHAFSAITGEIQQRLEELKDSCGLFAVVETFADDGSATYKFVLGYDNIFSPDAYLEFASGEQNTGTALQDPNETVVKLAGMMAEYPREYTGSITVETAADNSYFLS